MRPLRKGSPLWPATRTHPRMTALRQPTESGQSLAEAWCCRARQYPLLGARRCKPACCVFIEEGGELGDAVYADRAVLAVGTPLNIAPGLPGGGPQAPAEAARNICVLCKPAAIHDNLHTPSAAALLAAQLALIQLMSTGRQWCLYLDDYPAPLWQPFVPSLQLPASPASDVYAWTPQRLGPAALSSALLQLCLHPQRDPSQGLLSLLARSS